MFTGGPCAGKTTAMATLSADLTNLGYKVIMVPEAASLLMKAGAMIDSNLFTQTQAFQF